MKRIHKYRLPDVSRQPGAFTVQLPVGASIIEVNHQGGKLQIWAIIDPEAELEPRLFTYAETGKGLPYESMNHIGTVHLPGQHLVVHVFEIF